MNGSDRDTEAQKKAMQDQLREKMTALGYDADNERTVGKFNELEAKRDAGRITQNDVFREMDKHQFNEADRDRREAARQQHTHEEAVNRTQEAEKQKRDPGEIDIERYKSDPDYRREMRQSQACKSQEERTRDRENEIKQEEHERQR